jgi:NADH-quinone oxidoreductase subunit H
MATLFLGGWDIPGWKGDDAFFWQGQWISGFDAAGAAIPAQLAWWKTLLTLLVFTLKVGFFVLVYIWVRWTLPRFRYDQVMELGWKIMLPTGLAYVMVIAGTLLALDEIGLPFGILYGLVLTAVSAAATVIFMFWLDRDRIIGGASPPVRGRMPVRMPSVEVPSLHSGDAARIGAGTTGD